MTKSDLHNKLTNSISQIFSKEYLTFNQFFFEKINKNRLNYIKMKHVLKLKRIKRIFNKDQV